MPQNKNLSTEWQVALGQHWQDVQKTYLHTIGNLTLTAYNSELSDKYFTDKLDITGGFKESALRINSYVIKQTTWNANKIQERANELCELSKQIWKYPELTEDELKIFTQEDKGTSEYSIDNYEHLTGKMMSLYEMLNTRIMNISSEVKREFKKLYIAYKADTNFCDIVPQKSRLRISINMKFNEISDPKGLCVNVADKGRWGNGEVEVGIDNALKIDDIMELIIQGYNKQVEE